MTAEKKKKKSKEEEEELEKIAKKKKTAAKKKKERKKKDVGQFIFGDTVVASVVERKHLINGVFSRGRGC